MVSPTVNNNTNNNAANESQLAQAYNNTTSRAPSQPSVSISSLNTTQDVYSVSYSHCDTSAAYSSHNKNRRSPYDYPFPSRESPQQEALHRKPSRSASDNNVSLPWTNVSPHMPEEVPTAMPYHPNVAWESIVDLNEAEDCFIPEPRNMSFDMTPMTPAANFAGQAQAQAQTVPSIPAYPTPAICFLPNDADDEVTY